MLRHCHALSRPTIRCPDLILKEQEETEKKREKIWQQISSAMAFTLFQGETVENMFFSEICYIVLVLKKMFIGKARKKRNFLILFLISLKAALFFKYCWQTTFFIFIVSMVFVHFIDAQLWLNLKVPEFQKIHGKAKMYSHLPGEKFRYKFSPKFLHVMYIF